MGCGGSKDQPTKQSSEEQADPEKKEQEVVEEECDNDHSQPRGLGDDGDKGDDAACDENENEADAEGRPTSSANYEKDEHGRGGKRLGRPSLVTMSIDPDADEEALHHSRSLIGSRRRNGPGSPPSRGRNSGGKDYAFGSGTKHVDPNAMFGPPAPKHLPQITIHRGQNSAAAAAAATTAARRRARLNRNSAGEANATDGDGNPSGRKSAEARKKPAPHKPTLELVEVNGRKILRRIPSDDPTAAPGNKNKNSSGDGSGGGDGDGPREASLEMPHGECDMLDMSAEDCAIAAHIAASSDSEGAKVRRALQHDFDADGHDDDEDEEENDAVKNAASAGDSNDAVFADAEAIDAHSGEDTDTNADNTRAGEKTDGHSGDFSPPVRGTLAFDKLYGSGNDEPGSTSVSPGATSTQAPKSPRTSGGNQSAQGGGVGGAAGENQRTPRTPRTPRVPPSNHFSRTNTGSSVGSEGTRQFRAFERAVEEEERMRLNSAAASRDQSREVSAARSDTAVVGDNADEDGRKFSRQASNSSVTSVGSNGSGCGFVPPGVRVEPFSRGTSASSTGSRRGKPPVPSKMQKSERDRLEDHRRLQRKKDEKDQEAAMVGLVIEQNADALWPCQPGRKATATRAQLYDAVRNRWAAKERDAMSRTDAANGEELKSPSNSPASVATTATATAASPSAASLTGGASTSSYPSAAAGQSGAAAGDDRRELVDKVLGELERKADAAPFSMPPLAPASAGSKQPQPAAGRVGRKGTAGSAANSRGPSPSASAGGKSPASHASAPGYCPTTATGTGSDVESLVDANSVCGQVLLSRRGCVEECAHRLLVTLCAGQIPVWSSSTSNLPTTNADTASNSPLSGPPGQATPQKTAAGAKQRQGRGGKATPASSRAGTPAGSIHGAGKNAAEMSDEELKLNFDPASHERGMKARSVVLKAVKAAVQRVQSNATSAEAGNTSASGGAAAFSFPVDLMNDSSDDVLPMLDDGGGEDASKIDGLMDEADLLKSEQGNSKVAQGENAEKEAERARLRKHAKAAKKYGIALKELPPFISRPVFRLALLYLKGFAMYATYVAQIDSEFFAPHQQVISPFSSPRRDGSVTPTKNDDDEQQQDHQSSYDGNMQTTTQTSLQDTSMTMPISPDLSSAKSGPTDATTTPQHLSPADDTRAFELDAYLEFMQGAPGLVSGATTPRKPTKGGEAKTPNASPSKSPRSAGRLGSVEDGAHQMLRQALIAEPVLS